MITKKFIMLASELCAMAICADSNCSLKEIEDFANQTNPTGINSPWKISENNFADGRTNPCECQQDSGRKHYLLNC